MLTLLRLLSLAGLLLTVVPSFLVFSGLLELSSHKQLAFTGTVLWFLTAPFWMNRKKVDEKQVIYQEENQL